MRCADGEVRRFAFVNRLCRTHRRAPLPFLDDARIAGFGHRTRAEISADIERVLVDPVDLAFRHRQLEAVLHERLAGNAELAHRHCIATVRREGDQAALVGGLETLHALEHPAFVLGLVERVDVQQYLPLWLGLAVLGQRGASPDAARVSLVAPEVVKLVAHAVDVGNAGVGIEYLQDAVAGSGKLWIVHELLRRAGVLLLHPRHRTGSVDVLQPQERVVDGTCGRRGGGGCCVVGMGISHAGQCDAERQDHPD